MGKDLRTEIKYIKDKLNQICRCKDECKCIVEMTLPAFKNLKGDNNLVPGQLYKITGCHKNPMEGVYKDIPLYDDGTNSGITLYLRALTNNTISNSGYGEFYNPLYQSNSLYDEESLNGAWGIFDIDRIYSLGDRAIWGGYVWENISGYNSGPTNNSFELDVSYWVKLEYDNTVYRKVIDYIEYDIDNDWIVRRRDEIGEIDVTYSLRCLNENLDVSLRHPIAAMQWGNYNYPPASVKFGTCSIQVNNSSYYNCINFKGWLNSGIICTNNSRIFKSLYLKYSGLSNLKIDNSSIEALNLNIQSRIEDNIFFNTSFNGNYIKNTVVANNIFEGANIDGNYLEDSYMENNKVFKSSISNNVLSMSFISNNILTNNSEINNNTMDMLSSMMENNNLNASIIASNSFQTDECSIRSNVMHNSIMSGCMIGIEAKSDIIHNCMYNSYIQNCELSEGSIKSNEMYDSLILYALLNYGSIISYNNMVVSKLNLLNTGGISSKQLQYTTYRNTVVDENLSLSTIIYYDSITTPKEIYTRPDGMKRMKYYDDNDNLVITDVDA